MTSLAEPYDSTIAYAVMIRFLRLVGEAEPTDQDLESFLRWGELNSAGTKTFDPAFLEDWSNATGGRTAIGSDDAYAAMIAMLSKFALRGVSGATFVDRIRRLERKDLSSVWDTAVRLVSDDVEAGEPFRGSWTFGVDAQGNRVRLERDPETGRLRTIPV